MLKRVFFFLVHALIFPILVFAQNQVSGKVFDHEENPLFFSNIMLLQASDSTFVAGTIAEENGTFTLNEIKTGKYFCEISMVGYPRKQTPIFDLSGKSGVYDLGVITLNGDVELQEIEVVSQKQMFEQTIDRLVINVANSISMAGGSALDVLENAPGVTVDRQNESISIAGKDGVQVMINGRLKYVPAAALLQMLQGMSADNIQKIEIITTPPANLDAEGNAGYLNIVLKKQLDEGVNGSFALNIGYGRGLVGGSNLNLNYRKGRLNLYGDYTLNYTDRPQYFAFTRQNKHEGEISRLKTLSDRAYITNNQAAKIGFDYELSKKTTFGGLISGYNNISNLEAEGYTELGSDISLDTIIQLRTDLHSVWKHLSGNVNIVHKFNENQTLSADVDYLYYVENNPADYIVDYYDTGGNFTYENSFRTSKFTPIRTAVAKIDYIHNWSDNLQMEVGIKGVQSAFVNDLSVENRMGANWIQDPMLSGKYALDEKIGAAYISFGLEADSKTSVKAGLRYEYTWSILSTEENRALFNRRYGNLFPSLFVSRQIDKIHSINLAYSRRIRRQTFNDMAPFVLFMDPFSFWSGNEALLPSISDNVSLSFKHKAILFILQYTYEDNAIMRYQGKIDPETNRMILVTENLDFLKIVNMTLALPTTINSFWEMQNNIQYNYREAIFFFEGAGVFVKQGTYSINSTQRFKLGNDYSLELTGQYRSGELRGQFIATPYYGMNFGIQKKLKGQHGVLRFNIADVFDSFVFRTRNTLENQGLSMVGDWDFMQRTFRMTYSRNFGSNKVKAARKRAEAEEKSRVE
jgi:hypothetical protein